MSNYRFDLEKAVAAWRRMLEHNPSLSGEDVAELVQHLRDQVAVLTAEGHGQEEAFRRAMELTGDYATAESEYRKVYWGKVRRRRQLLHELSWRVSMLKNYLKIAYRNLLRHKGFAFINVFGLAVGIALCLLIALYVQFELSFDRYHEKVDRIYRLVHAYRFDDGQIGLPPPTPADYRVRGTAPVGPSLKADFPEVQEVVQFSGRRALLLQHDSRRFYQDNVFYADSTLFDVFSWPLRAGDPRTALARPFTAVLTKSSAQKYFGNDNPVGQTLVADNTQSYTVTGVVEDVPANSHFTFDVLLSMESMRRLGLGRFEDWEYADFYTYFLVPDAYDIRKLEAKLPAFVERHVSGYGYALGVEPLRDVYLHSAAARQPGATGNLSNLYVFSAVAIFILLIACTNFVNHALARAAERAKEVGVRKTAGARRASLVWQFLIESLLLSFVAGILAVCLTALALPLFQNLTGRAFSEWELFSPGILLVLAGVLSFAGLVAGSYPAFVLSGFRPATVLKGGFQAPSRGIVLRRALVAFQFGISVVLLAGTFVVFSQLNYLRSRPLGFERGHHVVVDFGYDDGVQQQVEPIKAAFLAHPAVVSVSASRSVPGRAFPSVTTFVEGPQGIMSQENPNAYEIDYDFLSVYGIEVAAGRFFSRAFPSDTTHALVLNEAAARHYGYIHPEDVVGKRFSQGGGRRGIVIGVVRDFNYQSLRRRVEPLTLRLARSWDLSYLTMDVQAGNLAVTIDTLARMWDRLAPQQPFQYSLLDVSLDGLYGTEERLGRLVTTFTGLALLIACLGLFVLVSLTIRQRTKEIGIRKVLGASVTNVVVLLTREVGWTVGIAFLVAVPPTYVVMERWLDGFAYRIGVSWWMFALAGGLALIVALATVSYQSFKAALADPVKSLRYE